MQSGMHVFDVTDCIYALDNTFRCVEITVIGTCFGVSRQQSLVRRDNILVRRDEIHQYIEIT